VVQRLLHQLQIACFPQQLRADVVAEVMEAESLDGGTLADTLQIDFTPL
jgi:hypothetical protein